MRSGQTFHGEVIGVGKHLHVILSNPSNGLVVLTMIGTYDESHKNGTCVLSPSDNHPFIKRRSYVA